MPVGRTYRLLAWLLVGLALPLGSHAQSHQLISNLSQLENDKAIRHYKTVYETLSGANVIYAQCGAVLKITPPEQDYLKQKFSTVSQGYLAAYQDAYVAAVGALPPQSFLNDVAQALMKRQQEVVNHMAQMLQQPKGCQDGRLRMIVKYVRDLQQQDLAEQNTKPAAPVEPYH